MAQKEIDFVVGYEQDFLGVLIAQKLGCEFIAFRNNYYPDGSPSPIIDADYDALSGKNILTVWRTSQRPERDVVCRYLVNYPRLIGSLTDKETFNVANVDVLYPYSVLGRQDHNPKTDEKAIVRSRDRGRDIGYKYEMRNFKANGARKVLTFHPHYRRAPGKIFIEGLEVICLDAVPYLAAHAKKQGLVTTDTIAVSPDYKQGYNITEALAKELGIPFTYIDKVRLSAEKTMSKKNIRAEEKSILVVDDIGSTLSTIETALESIEAHVRADLFFVHGVFTEDGLSRAQRMVRKGHVKSISSTDTIRSDYAHISLTEAIAKFYEEHSP